MSVPSPLSTSAEPRSAVRSAPLPPDPAAAATGGSATEGSGTEASGSHRAAAAAAVADRFLELLAAGDFASLEELLTPDVWLRALLVKTCHESNSAGEAVAGLRRWVGSPHGRQVLETGRHSMAGREFVRYRFRVRPHFAPEVWHVVEQSGYCRVADGRIRRLDLVCTGYFPEEP